MQGSNQPERVVGVWRPPTTCRVYRLFIDIEDIMSEHEFSDDISEALTSVTDMGWRKPVQGTTQDEQPEIQNLADAPSGEVVREMSKMQQMRDYVAWQATEQKARGIRLQGNIKRREAQLRASYKNGVLKEGQSVDDVCMADVLYASLLMRREVCNQEQLLLDRWAEQLSENIKVLTRVLEARRQEMELHKAGIIANRPQSKTEARQRRFKS